MAKLEEVTLTYNRERIRFHRSDEGDDDVTAMAIIECRVAAGEQPLDWDDAVAADPGVIVKVECTRNDFVEGLDYRFYGSWTEHERYGRQFAARTFVRTQPHNQTGVICYLTQAPWIGKAIAKVLWDRFGGDAVRIVRSMPEVAVAAVGGQFNEARAKEAAAFFQQEQALEDVSIDLIDLLAGRGFPKDTARQAVKEWGNRAAERIRRNPYWLILFRGCGFLRTDQLFLDLGGRPERLKRQALCAWFVLARNTEGHTWHDPAVIEAGVCERVSGTEVRPVDALKLARRAKMLSTCRDANGQLWVAEYGKARSESMAARRVRNWLASPTNWPHSSRLDVSPHQRSVLSEALACPLSIFTGGPGTGKSYVAGSLVGEMTRLGRKVAVAAPTGKAAVRISEVMNLRGIDLRATTIHSLLSVAENSKSGGWSFTHNAGNPLEHEYLIIDEASMIDTSLAASLFDACAKSTHVLLVGDTGQLPPVGHGAPLRDLIAAGVPCGELTEIRRNCGQIVRACHEIRAGRTFEVSPEVNLELGHNLKVLPAVSGPACLEKIVKTIRALAARGLANPIWDCQVIVAVNAKSDLSRRAVNLRLQQELNPGGERVGDNPFRVGDKIVCLKNGFYPIVKEAPYPFNQFAVDGKVIVANGEQGGVKYVAPRFTIAQLDAPARLVLIPRGSQAETDDTPDDDSAPTGCAWDLAYGISCHKSQGSEWPIVFVALDEYPGARMVCSREWLYTGISRAKQVCFLCGKLSTAYGMIERQAIANRQTFMRELIIS